MLQANVFIEAKQVWLLKLIDTVIAWQSIMWNDCTGMVPILVDLFLLCSVS